MRWTLAREFKIGRLSFIISLIILVVAVGLLIFSFYHEAKLKIKNSDLENKNIHLEDEIQTTEKIISEQKINIKELELEINNLKNNLKVITQKYEEAKPYQERVSRGQDLAQSYALLKDREDFAKPLILKYLGLTTPTITKNDDELWERGRLIYNWLSENYKYCGDKGLRIGTTFYEFQFWSPDEILKSDNARCGDCDDFATLFAGLMYASGVPEDKVWVVCGTVPSGGHCWNWLSLSNQTYRIDTVCSQRQELFNFLGLKWGPKEAYYTHKKENVDCFSEYKEQMKMNSNSFNVIT